MMTRMMTMMTRMMSMMTRMKSDGRNALTLKLMIKAWAFALLLLLVAASVTALGVSPARIRFADVLPGGYAETSVLVSNPKEMPILLLLSFKGEGAEWYAAEPAEVTIPSKSSARIALTISPPPDAEPRSHDAKLHLTATPIIDDAPGNRLAISLEAPLSLEIVGEDRPSCVVGGLSLPALEPGLTIRGSYRVKNDGNVRMTPRGVLVLTDAAGDILFRADILGDEVLPTTTTEQLFSFEHRLAEGEYLASLNLNACGAADARFSVVAPGTLAPGTFLGLVAETNGPILSSENVPISARFRNTGGRIVPISFSGVVEQEGRILRLLETETLLVAPSEEVRLESFFVPSEPGVYTIRGSLVWEDRRSEERSITLQVLPSPEGEETTLVIVATALLLLFLAALASIVVARRR